MAYGYRGLGVICWRAFDEAVKRSKDSERKGACADDEGYSYPYRTYESRMQNLPNSRFLNTCNENLRKTKKSFSPRVRMT